MKNGTLPDIANAASIAQMTENYTIIDNCLFRLNQNPVDKPRWIVPEECIIKVLEENHDHPTAAHMGFKRTYERIKANYYWLSMYADIKEYCKSCWTWRTFKSIHERTKASLKPIPVGGPFHRVSVDFVGPLPRSTAGHKYVIVFIDYLTKYAEAKAVKKADAATTADAFVELIVLRHSAPSYLHSVRATVFMSNMLQEICRELQVTKTFTSGYRPNCSGLV